MLKSARFVIEKTINPAIELYEKTKNLNEILIDQERFEIIKKIRDQSNASRIVISRFKKTGDLYNYLKKSIDTSDGKTQKYMRILQLTPFEAIMDEFVLKFKNEINEYSEETDLVIGEVYTTFDFVFLAKMYRTQVTRILSLTNTENEVYAVIARGGFNEVNQEYENQYLEPDKSRIKYYLIKGNHKYNKLITEKKLEIYFFETIGPNQQKFLGVYNLESHSPKDNFVVLRRVRNKGTSKKENKSKKLNLKNHKKYRRKFRITDKRASGHANIGRLKVKVGEKGEIVVSDFLNLKNISNEIISNGNKAHKYDIKVENLYNLEVKNITSSKGFYLSDSQIFEYRDGNTRICLVDVHNDTELIYISKSYEDTIELKRILSQILELKEYSIKESKGILRIDSVEIGLVEPVNEVFGDIYEDFVLINTLTRQEIISHLQ